MRILIGLPLLLLTACSGSDGDTALVDPTDQPTDQPACEYPDGAQAEMAIGAVVTPYSWPEAIHGDGTVAAIDLEKVHCDTDPEVDWGLNQAILFVSVPAW